MNSKFLKKLNLVLVLGFLVGCGNDSSSSRGGSAATPGPQAPGGSATPMGYPTEVTNSKICKGATPRNTVIKGQKWMRIFEDDSRKIVTTLTFGTNTIKIRNNCYTQYARAAFAEAVATARITSKEVITTQPVGYSIPYGPNNENVCSAQIFGPLKTPYRFKGPCLEIDPEGQRILYVPEKLVKSTKPSFDIDENTERGNPSPNPRRGRSGEGYIR